MWMAQSELVHIAHVIGECAHGLDSGPAHQCNRGDYSHPRDSTRLQQGRKQCTAENEKERIRRKIVAHADVDVAEKNEKRVKNKRPEHPQMVRVSFLDHMESGPPEGG